MVVLSIVLDIGRNYYLFVFPKKGYYNEKRNKLAIDAYHLAYGRNGGLSERYAEVVGAYYEFIKYLKATKEIDFTKHR